MSTHTFEIVTESCANMPVSLSDKYGIVYLPMVNLIGGTEQVVNTGRFTEDEANSFYNKLANKVVINTACVSEADALNIFTPLLKNGKDILYLSLSSALSASYEVVSSTLEKLKKEYPDNKILYVDLLAAAMGHALMINFAAEKREKGETIEQVYEAVLNNRMKLHSLFTVENLSYLYRGGRLRKSSYLIASTLNIKPVMRVNPEGKLVAFGKVFGRKMSISSLVNNTVSLIKNPESQTIFISHAQCLDDAELYISKLKDKIAVKGFKTEILDLVIGAHTGPGCLAVFFFGDDRV